MTIGLPDRPALFRAIVDVLNDEVTVPWPAALTRRPDGAGGNPADIFVPYIVVWPLNTTTTAAMTNSDGNNQTQVQLTCVSNADEASDLDGRASIIADRAVTVLLRARRTGLLDTDGQTVTLAKIDVVNGPFRDREDDRLRVVHALLRFHCQPSEV